MRKITVATTTCALALFSACNKQHHTAGKPRAKIDACTLLTAEEIQQVQGAPVKDTKGTEQTNGKVRLSQCYFAADPTNRSVSLSITQSDAGGDADAAAEVWRQTFARAREGAKEEGEEEREKRKSLQENEREEEGPPPKKIEHVGEEAYWAGSRVGGALYVLKGDVFIRISLGGPDTEEAKIDKSKALATKALQHL